MAEGKKVAAAIGVVGLVAGGLLLATRKAAADPPGETPEPAPDIRLSNLRIQPSEILIGESTLIIVTATNLGDAPGERVIDLLVGSQEDFPLADFREVEIVQLEPGAFINVVFTVTPDSIRIYDVSVDGLSGSFRVNGIPYELPDDTPAGDIRLSNLAIHFEMTDGYKPWWPPELRAMISFTATNFADEDGIMLIILYINGSIAGGLPHFVPANSSITSHFEYTPPEPGTYNVEIDGLIGSFIWTYIRP